VISFVFLSSRTPTPLQLYAANFQPYPNAFEPTQRDANVSRDKRATAFAAYEQKNYEVAATLFKELVAEKNEPEILLLLGNANMILDRDDEAMNNFQSLINEFDALDEQGKWYLSLCYVKSGEVDEAKKILKDIDSEQAHKLLNKLK
jgi:tetratricopeptide (TPR) repeat protein